VALVAVNRPAPATPVGLFQGYTDKAGNGTTITYDAHGNVTTVTRNDPSGTITETYNFAYYPSGTNAGLVSSVTVQRQPHPGNPYTVRQANYTYYDGCPPFRNDCRFFPLNR
jgi:YD repeat-containing protein